MICSLIHTNEVLIRSAMVLLQKYRGHLKGIGKVLIKSGTAGHVKISRNNQRENL